MSPYLQAVHYGHWSPLLVEYVTLLNPAFSVTLLKIHSGVKGGARSWKYKISEHWDFLTKKEGLRWGRVRQKSLPQLAKTFLPAKLHTHIHTHHPLVYLPLAGSSPYSLVVFFSWCDGIFPLVWRKNQPVIAVLHHGLGIAITKQLELWFITSN